MCQRSSPYGLNDSWVATHAQVVVAAPDGHLRGRPGHNGIVFGERENLCVAIHRLKNAVGVVALLLHDLLGEKVIVVETGSN